jgi:hypothetical protein
VSKYKTWLPWQRVVYQNKYSKARKALEWAHRCTQHSRCLLGINFRSWTPNPSTENALLTCACSKTILSAGEALFCFSFQLSFQSHFLPFCASPALLIRPDKTHSSEKMRSARMSGKNSKKMPHEWSPRVYGSRMLRRLPVIFFTLTPQIHVVRFVSGYTKSSLCVYARSRVALSLTRKGEHWKSWIYIKTPSNTLKKEKFVDIFEIFRINVIKSPHIQIDLLQNSPAGRFCF